jgi:hypothetical protein
MKKVVNVALIMLGIVILIGIIGYIKSDDKPDVYDIVLAEPYQKVIDDAIKQYEIVKRNGSAQDRYASASMVCQAYLQAKDETNYTKWKAIQKEEANAAGLPTE